MIKIAAGFNAFKNPPNGPGPVNWKIEDCHRIVAKGAARQPAVRLRSWLKQPDGEMANGPCNARTSGRARFGLTNRNTV